MSLNKQPNSDITMELDHLIKIYTIIFYQRGVDDGTNKNNDS